MDTSKSEVEKKGRVSLERTGRIQNAEDKDVNETLFGLYRKLINPVRDLEQKIAKQENNKIKIAEAKNARMITIGGVLKLAVVIFFIMFIVNFALHEGIENKLHSAYEQQYSAQGGELDVYDWIEKEHPIYAFMITQGYGFIEFLWKYFLVATIISIIDWVVIEIVVKKASQKNINNLETENAELDIQISDSISSLRKYMVFVPPAYRTSDALNYFAESYFNNRVDNLKEAVLLYDDYKFKNESLQGQREMIERLQSIEYTQLTIMDQLNDIIV